VIEFTGLPTFNTKYHLTITSGDVSDVVFEEQSLLGLVTVIEHARTSLLEPDADSQEQTSTSTGQGYPDDAAR
jgi:hypothetical protein